MLFLPLKGTAQINIPDTIPGKGFFIGQLNLAKHIMDFFVDKRDASNAAKIDSNYIGYYPEKLLFSAGLAQSGGWLAMKDDDSSWRLGSDISRSLSLRASYRGLAMCFALNPFNMFGNTDSEFDISFYGDTKPQTYVTCQPGQMVIFFPQDGHAPCISEKPVIKKAIFKVKA